MRFKLWLESFEHPPGHPSDRFGFTRDDPKHPFNNPMFNCDDCGVNTLKIGEYPYTAKNEIWQKYGSPGMLCIACLEKRIGRKLTKDDFLHGPNKKFSPELNSRLEGQ